MASSLRKCGLRGRVLAGAVVGILGASSAHAAVRLSDAFDGNWFDPAASGRGISFDYIPDTTGKFGTLFGATFTFDNAGQPTWLVFVPQVSEFATGATNFDILKVTGGSFAGFDPTTNTVVGKGSITVNSCTSMSLNVDMDAGTGLADFTWPLVPVNGIGQGECAYQRAFTACPSFATPAPAFGDRACTISGNFENQNITLTNEITWVISGKVGIGGDNVNPASLTIEPGTLLVSTGDTFDHIAVSRGSKIFAEGTPNAPIVLTSPEELPGFSGNPQPRDVGGIVLAGDAPANCNPNCVAEWDPTLRYGGNDAHDSSGILRYVQVRYAGFVFATNRELNSFTLSGVGSGTVLEHLQAYHGADDAIEFFGGTANVRYFVDTCNGDDSIDWDEGYSGKVQFALLRQGGCAGENHGFELANSPSNFDASPRATGTLANVTAIGDSASTVQSDGFNLKEGTGGHFWNVVMVDFNRSCVAIQDAATQAAAGASNALTGVLTVNNTIIDCANLYRDSGVTAGYTQAWFTSQSGNQAVDPQLTGFLPAAGSPVFGKTFAPADDWFVPTDYAGAFAGNSEKDDWTRNWTHNIANQ
jgi:hypothetical protein